MVDYTNILKTELEIKKYRIEHAHLFDLDGCLKREFVGAKSKVKFNIKELLPHHILTHNHPTFFLSRCRPLSLADITTLLAGELYEIRAVDKNHVHSLIRTAKPSDKETILKYLQEDNKDLLINHLEKEDYAVSMTIQLKDIIA